eukprot:1108068-Pelagomonas_calceolata.AAC.3
MLQTTTAKSSPPPPTELDSAMNSEVTWASWHSVPRKKEAWWLNELPFLLLTIPLCYSLHAPTYGSVAKDLGGVVSLGIFSTVFMHSHSSAQIILHLSVPPCVPVCIPILYAMPSEGVLHVWCPYVLPILITCVSRSPVHHLWVFGWHTRLPELGADVLPLHLCIIHRCQVSGLRTRLAESRAEQDRLKTVVETLVRERSAATAQASALQQELDSLKGALAEARAFGESHHAQAQALRAECTATREQLEGCSTGLEEAVKRLGAGAELVVWLCGGVQHGRGGGSKVTGVGVMSRLGRIMGVEEAVQRLAWG